MDHLVFWSIGIRGKCRDPGRPLPGLLLPRNALVRSWHLQTGRSNISPVRTKVSYMD